MAEKEDYVKPLESLIKELSVDPERGLSHSEALKRVKTYGRNKLEREAKTSTLMLFLSQFKNFFVIILLAAGVIAYSVGELRDAAVVGFIIAINVALGFIQEYKAARVIEALLELSAPRARVLRDYLKVDVETEELVPGDVILLEAGVRIPADARIIEAKGLTVDESALTGESIPVNKDPKYTAKEKVPLGDQKNMVFLGTMVMAGRGKAVITKTGMNTVMGGIAELMGETEREKPVILEKLEQMGTKIAFLVVLLCSFVFILGIFRGEDPYTMLLVMITLAVGAIPEALPVLLTVALAVGIQRMVRQDAIIRKLPTIQTLGTVSVICSDKTGTLTENKLVVKKLYGDGNVVDVKEDDDETKGKFYIGDKEIDPSQHPTYSQILKYAVLCSDVDIRERRSYPLGIYLKGDPTEVALVMAAHKAGHAKEELDKQYPRVDEIPFDSGRMMMTTVHKKDKGYLVVSKGALAVIMGTSNRIHEKAREIPLTEAKKKEITKINDKFAEKGLRTLAIAYKELDKLPSKISSENIEKDMVFLGCKAMTDPPRKGIRKALQLCKDAGIRTIMITGDHKKTATSIGKEIGILDDEGLVVSGEELDRMGELELWQKIPQIRVFARVAPRHKARIVQLLQDTGEVVAMTGDGVNDGPALKRADVGISMGVKGTDVAKEASDMILANDNFISIVDAIREGRKIYENIITFIKYLFSNCLTEFTTIFFAVLLGFPRPYLPIHILWINLVCDAWPAISLGLAPAEEGIMKKKPISKKEEILTPNRIRYILTYGLYMSLGTLALFLWEIKLNPALVTARTITMAFTTLICFELLHSFITESGDKSIFRKGIFYNKLLVLTVLASFAAQLLIIYTPLLQPIFSTYPLGAGDWAKIILVSSSALVLTEAYKALKGFKENMTKKTPALFA